MDGTVVGTGLSVESMFDRPGVYRVSGGVNGAEAAALATITLHPWQQQGQFQIWH